MPLGRPPWPASDCDTFRKWIDQGMLYGNPSSTPNSTTSVTPPIAPLRVRKDILTLTDNELQEYREAVERMGSMTPNSNWAKFGNLHGQWCLHYQEAFILWHRAHLLYVESQLGVPIPYWNWMSPDAPQKGLPRAFTDREYVSKDGTTRPNPLYNALGVDGRTVTYRYGPITPEYNQLITIYQKQIALANTHTIFSLPQGEGFPWANLPDFTPHQPTSDYTSGGETYDRYLEQPHDNVHGWIGGDMANNAKTAFDPIFYSHHSNLDRLFYNWQLANPKAQYTLATVLLPFASDNATQLKDAYHPDTKPDPTTVGDMARDIKKLGYCYQTPNVPDAFCSARTLVPDLKLAAVDRTKEHLKLRLPGVKCSLNSYTLYVFLNSPAHPTLQDANTINPHFCSMQHRSGMGTSINSGRCVKDGITQTLDVTETAHKLGLSSSDPLPRVQLLVLDGETKKELTVNEVHHLPGVKPILHWVKTHHKAKTALHQECCK